MTYINREYQILGPVVLTCNQCDTLIPIPVWAKTDTDEIEFVTDPTDWDAHQLSHEV